LFEAAIEMTVEMTLEMMDLFSHFEETRQKTDLFPSFESRASIGPWRLFGLDQIYRDQSQRDDQANLLLMDLYEIANL
jgi:hypothetical protein